MNRSLRLMPGRIAPFVGCLVGAWLGYQAWVENPDLSRDVTTATGAVIGLVAGLCVWLADWLTIRRGLAAFERDKFRTEPPALQPASVASQLPLAAMLLSWIPVAGLVVSFVAYRTTRGESLLAFYSFIPSGASTLAALMILPRYWTS